jgi:sortase A
MSRSEEQPIDQNAQGEGLDSSRSRGPSRPRGRTKRVLRAVRTRTLPRRILKTFTVLLLLGGAGLLAYPFLTNMYGSYRQGRLRTEFQAPSIQQQYLTRTIPVGHALTRLQIPRLDVDTIVVQGTTLAALRAGSGHYPHTPLPCEPGNVAIAGHRTTYSHPFAQINTLKPGDVIILSTPLGTCEYKVSMKPWSTTPYDWAVARNLRGSFLTLTTCDPPGSASRRLVVRAKLFKSNIKGLPLPPPPRAGREQKGALPGPV